MVIRKRLYSESCHFLALTSIPYKYNQCHTFLGGLSSVCAKLEPASSKNEEILKINVLQKFTSHALYLNVFISSSMQTRITLTSHHYNIFTTTMESFQKRTVCRKKVPLSGKTRN